MAARTGLTVRQHERAGIEVPVVFVISPEHGTQVRFSTSSSAPDPHVIRGEAIDISPGGMGVRCKQFLPRMCEGVLRVLLPDGVDDNGAPRLVPIFEHSAKVRRVTMLSREPSYSLGIAFLNADAQLEENIAALMDRLQDSYPLQTEGGEGSHA